MTIQWNDKSNKNFLNVLQDEYVNILNSIDYEKTNDSTIKMLLELIYWLPTINRFLFTKLSILIIHKKIDLFNVNQILGIIKTRTETQFEFCDQSDFLMFLMNIVNGYTSFDLLNNLTQNENNFLVFDASKHQNHMILLKTVMKFLRSLKNSSSIIEILLSCIVPTLNRLSKTWSSTIHGVLSLIRNSDEFSESFNYDDIIVLINKILFSLLNKCILEKKIFSEINSTESGNVEIQCMQALLKEIMNIFDKNSSILVFTLNDLLATTNSSILI